MPLAPCNDVLAIYRHLTNPECRQYLLRQAFEEAVHTHAFRYLVESLGLDEGELFNMNREIPSITDKAAEEGEELLRDPGHRVSERRRAEPGLTDNRVRRFRPTLDIRRCRRSNTER
jgi:ribonucleotide reductase beta subunit family protein with ferritin-like domain